MGARRQGNRLFLVFAVLCLEGLGLGCQGERVDLSPDRAVDSSELPDQVSTDPFDGDENADDSEVGDSSASYPPLPHQPIRLCMAAGIPYGGNPSYGPQVDWRLDRYGEAYIRILRSDFRWNDAEPEPGQYDFSRFEQQVNAADSRDIEFVALVSGSAYWANGNRDSIYYPPLDPEDYGRFLFELSSHFEGRIRYYEIWNEQNAGYRFWLPSDDPSAYGELLKSAYIHIHQANADATVAMGGLFDQELIIPSALEFLGDLFRAHPDICEYFDVFAYHPYRYPFTAPEYEDALQPSQQTTLHRLRLLLHDQGCGDTPIWITEIGWHTAPESPFAGVSLEEQAFYLIRSAVLAFSQGVSLVCWYTFEDGPDAQTWQEHAFGVYEYDPTADDLEFPKSKPAFLALRTLGELLDGAVYVGSARDEFGLGIDEYSETFDRNDGSTVTVLWRPQGERILDLLPSGLTLVDWRGESCIEAVISEAPIFALGTSDP